MVPRNAGVRLRYPGLNEELTGNADAATRDYLGIVTAMPQSPWSWLAWTRLVPADR
jgi:hypothetical protein